MFAGKTFAGKYPQESKSSSFVVSASEKVLVPGSQSSDGSSSLKGKFEAADLAVEDSLVSASCSALDMNASCNRKTFAESATQELEG